MYVCMYVDIYIYIYNIYIYIIYIYIYYTYIERDQVGIIGGYDCELLRRLY